MRRKNPMSDEERISLLNLLKNSWKEANHKGIMNWYEKNIYN